MNLTGSKPAWYPRWHEFVTAVQDGKMSVNDLLIRLDTIGAIPVNQTSEAQRIDYVALNEALKTLGAEKLLRKEQA